MSSTPYPGQPSSPEPTWHGSPQPGAAPAGGSPWGAPHPQQGGPTQPTAAPPAPAPRRPRRGGCVAIVVVALLLLALAGAALMAVRSQNGPASTGTTSSGLPEAGEAPAAPVQQADASAPDWSATAAAVSPSVVSITVEAADSGGEGSGVIIDAAGHVLTNHHVVAAGGAGADILVTLADKRVFAAKIVGTDAATDLAVLALEGAPTDLRPITPGSDRDLKVGQPVMAIGNPLGLSGTVTTGIVSALNRPVSTTQEAPRGDSPFGAPQQGEVVVTNAIQTSAAINPGNSGGALVDASGKLVGINSSIASLSQQSGNIGIGFAIPVSEAQSVAQQLIGKGRVAHPYLGVRLGSTVAAEGATKRRAAEIGQVEPGTPASRAGLRAGDAVIAIDGTPVDSALSLTAQVRAREVGASATLTVIRDGKRQDVKVTLAERRN